MATDFRAMIPLAARDNHPRVRRSRNATQCRKIASAVLWRLGRERIEVGRPDFIRRKPVATPDV